MENISRGVFISAFGKRGYGFAAWNLAFSIKKFSDVPIALFCQQETIGQLSPDKMNLFDEVIFIPKELLQPFDPCKVKINIYNYLPYDINLVLDADSLALKDVTQCFTDFEESGRNHATHIYKTWTIDKGRDFPEMWWAWCDDIWEHYKLPQDAVLPATNSSWQFVKKCDESKKLFDKIKENYANPIPLGKLKNKWGGTQPDELYLNIALAQEGFKEYPPVMFFGSHIDNRRFTQLTNDYYFLSIFGGRKTTKDIYIQWYDKLMFQYCRENIPKIGHDFKTNYINADKHMNNPLKLPKERNGAVLLPSNGHVVQLKKAVLPISLTQKVDSKKLIQSYTGSKGFTIKPTNFFNCSAAEFEGKKYFAYRMEKQPWCTQMKIGLCLLGDDLQPIDGTHSILQFDSAKPDFHCEDPRLFVFNNQLFVTYMGIGKDGYAVGMASINNMQAKDAFFFDKFSKIEKNWTFFGEEKLYCIYTPHRIFEVEGNKLKNEIKTNLPEWKWGIPRGGTCPQRHGDYYISFFHSSLDMKFNPRTPPGRQYFMGAYLFESAYPFTPVAISKEPLLAGEKMDENIPRMWNKLYVVFPNGKFRKENSWMVSFGYNDYECRFVEIQDSLLEENLTWIKQKELA